METPKECGTDVVTDTILRVRHVLTTDSRKLKITGFSRRLAA